MFWTFCVILLVVCQVCQADSGLGVVATACMRNPELPYCKELDKQKVEQDEHRKILLDRLQQMETRKKVNSTRRAHDIPLAEEDRVWLTKIAESVERFKRDPFSDIENAKIVRKSNTTSQKASHSDSDLREEETSGSGAQESEEGLIREEQPVTSHALKEKENIRGHLEEETDESHPPRQIAEDTEEVARVRGTSESYCDQYEQHFSFYCIGDTDHTGQHEAEISKFCPAYKAACAHKRITSSVSLTAWPRDPFKKKVSSRATVKESNESSEEDSEELTSEEELFERREAYIKELKRRIPCKPDCDSRFYPHCTAECKCDYLYPAVQRFCNPPPMPLFLNTCRLWYNGCPKYAQYHYASQYIYSKAEKGKRVPGPYIANPNPYNIPTGANQPPLSAAGRPTREQIYSDNPQSLRPLARSSSTLVIPPPLPDSVRRDAVEETSRKESTRKTTASKIRRKSHNSGTYRKMSNRELYQVLRAINGLTTNPVGITSDPASLKGGYQSRNDDPQQRRPRAQQAGTFPVVPTDAEIDGDSTFKRFDGLTDSAGILHKPRSRSPYSKPGLWEPNPDDPHNRDHANKYFFAPRSVGVDWLNGQVAWGGHWAVPAAGVGGTDGYSTVHFPTIGTFLNIPDDYD